MIILNITYCSGHIQHIVILFLSLSGCSFIIIWETVPVSHHLSSLFMESYTRRDFLISCAYCLHCLVFIATARESYCRSEHQDINNTVVEPLKELSVGMSIDPVKLFVTSLFLQYCNEKTFDSCSNYKNIICVKNSALFIHLWY